jgi:2-hydroxy-3-keto-5-methylthiopentenyl-1-phosphate phosphatase
MKIQSIAVFCDFDGTIARRDVGYNLFRHFSGGRNNELIPDWKAGRLSTRECLLQEAAMVDATEQEIYRFLDQFELDSGFRSFVDLCRANDTDLFVVSDGLDFYIEYILRRYRLDFLPVIANRGFVRDRRVVVEFPRHNLTCQRCGSCKGERIREYRQRQASQMRILFVGDGYSDLCAADEADVIFAKKDLEKYCRRHDIEFHSYDDFFDVARQAVRLGYMRTG